MIKVIEKNDKSPQSSATRIRQELRINKYLKGLVYAQHSTGTELRHTIRVSSLLFSHSKSERHTVVEIRAPVGAERREKK